MKSRTDWAHRVALVTGASTGIGRAVARDFVARGVRVALVARSADRLAALATELGPDSALGIPLDVTDRLALKELPGRVKARWGRLDFVVNNAGVNHRGAVLERTPEELASILETNLVAPVLLTHAALPLLEADGVVVNVASLAGKVPVPHEAAYSSSKAGLRAFGRALNTELSLHGQRIRVATVCPGPVDTGFLGEDLSLVPDLVFSQPMSTAEEVAEAVFVVIERGLQELDVPAISGKLATLGYLSPRVFGALRPLLERMGARRKAHFTARNAARLRAR
jgi:short-subunit dehydrogenase